MCVCVFVCVRVCVPRTRRTSSKVESEKSKVCTVCSFLSKTFCDFLNMIMVIIKSAAGPSETVDPEPEEEVEGMPTLGVGLPSFLILNSPNL